MARKKSLDLGPVLHEQILRSASSLFAERGYSGASIRDIAKAVGISSSTMYHHFVNKQAILGEILVEFMVSFNAAALPVLRDQSRPPAQRIADMVGLTIRMGDKHRSELRFGRPLRYALAPDQTAAVIGMQREVNDAVRDVVEQGCAAGDFDVADASISTMAVLDMLNGVREWFDPSGRTSLDDLIGHYTDYCLGILAFQSSARTNAENAPAQRVRQFEQ